MFLASSNEVITVEKSLLTRKANEFPFRLRLSSILLLLNFLIFQVNTIPGSEDNKSCSVRNYYQMPPESRVLKTALEIIEGYDSHWRLLHSWNMRDWSIESSQQYLLKVSQA